MKMKHAFEYCASSSRKRVNALILACIACSTGCIPILISAFVHRSTSMHLIPMTTFLSMLGYGLWSHFKCVGQHSSIFEGHKEAMSVRCILRNPCTAKKRSTCLLGGFIRAVLQDDLQQGPHGLTTSSFPLKSTTFAFVRIDL